MASSPEEGTSTLEAVLGDFTESWDRGERPLAEAYLARLRDEDSAELIYHEYCLAEAADLDPDPADYLRRFPGKSGPLSRLFALHGVFSSETLRDWASPVELPSSGDQIGPYHLLRELGRGAFARVFLAEQADLDHRLVVLKVSTRSTAEPQLLARVRHPHIVEVLRHATAEDGGLHLVCLPFLGGATLAAVLESRRKLGRRARSGLDLLADLDRVAAPEYLSGGLVRSSREGVAGLTYPRAVAWISARLAEALDHACGRGVTHGDLKPSNILLTAEGSPLLLDFNLSVDWRDVDQGQASGLGLGGTLAYMAPERLGTIARGGSDAGAGISGRHRADLYSLGLVLLEALTGQAPVVPRRRLYDVRDQAGALADLRRDLPEAVRGADPRQIPPALRSILEKCLAPHPLDRYARGQELAEDLDLWRTDRPLAFAEEPRRSVLARRARRNRGPLIASSLTLVMAVVASLTASILMKGSRRDVARSRYSSIIDRADSGAFPFRESGQWRLGDYQSDPAELAARQLARYQVLDDPNWADRDDIQNLPDRERDELKAWLMEQILRRAVALGERPDAPNDWNRGLGLLERTLARTASEPLEAARQRLRAKLKLPEIGPLSPARARLPDWMEVYLSGVAAEPLHARQALDHYLHALQLHPDLFWARYRSAAAAFRIGEYRVAIAELRGCVARSPENPALRLMLGSAIFQAEGDTHQLHRETSLGDALTECDRAVSLDPDFAMAYRIRAYIRKTWGQAEGVEEDLRTYARLTGRLGPGRTLALRVNLLYHPGPNHPSPSRSTEEMARRVLADNPQDQEIRMKLAVLIAVDRRHSEAIDEYDRVIAADGEHLRARYQRALQLRRLEPTRAIPEFVELIDHPRFEELLVQEPAAIRAFHFVAGDLMTQGRIDQALEVASRALVHINRARALSNEVLFAQSKAPNASPLSPRGETYYLIAQIHAHRAWADRGRIDQVAENLGIAFSRNSAFKTVWFARDRLFAGIREEILEHLKTTSTTPRPKD